MPETETTQPSSEDQDIAVLITQNIALSEAIQVQNKKILSHLRWMSVMGILRVLIILIPIILGIIYIPPLIGSMMGQYQSLFSGTLGMSADTSAVTQILEQVGNTTGIDIHSLLQQGERQ